MGRHSREERSGNNGDQGTSPHRPRTATICQDAFRARAGSFGTSDVMRPRSASHGNARYRDLRRTQTSAGTGSGIGASRNSSQESLRSKAASVVNRISSRESVNSANSEYLDMNPGRGSPSMSSLQRHKHKPQPLTDEYMQMSSNTDEYVPMDPPKKVDRSSGAYPKSSLSSKSRSSGSSSSIHGKHHSSSESLSSGSEGRGRTRVVLNTSMDTQDHSEYMDFDYQNPRGSPSNSKVPSFASSPSGSRSPKSKSQDADDSSYVSYSPGGSSSREHSPNLARSGPLMDKVISPIRETSLMAAPFSPISPMNLFTSYKGKGATTSQPGKHEYVNVQYKQTETVYEQMEYQNQEQDDPKPEVKPKSMMQEDEYMPFDFGPNNVESKIKDSKTMSSVSKDKGGANDIEDNYMEFEPQTQKSVASSVSRSVVSPSIASSNPSVVSSNVVSSSSNVTSSNVDDDEYMLCDPPPKEGGQLQPASPSPQLPKQQQMHLPMQQQIDREQGVAKITVSGKMVLQQQQPKQQHHLISPSRYSPPPTPPSSSSGIPKPSSTVSLKSALLASQPTVVSSSTADDNSPYMDFNPTQTKTNSSKPEPMQTDPSDYMDFKPGPSNTESVEKDPSKSKCSNVTESVPSASGDQLNPDTLDKEKKDDSETEDYFTLNYATLELGDATEDAAKNPGLKDAVAGGPSYAEIDYKKSQELLHEQEAKKETKAPFDL